MHQKHYLEVGAKCNKAVRPHTGLTRACMGHCSVSDYKSHIPDINKPCLDAKAMQRHMHACRIKDKHTHKFLIQKVVNKTGSRHTGHKKDLLHRSSDDVSHIFADACEDVCKHTTWDFCRQIHAERVYMRQGVSAV